MIDNNPQLKGRMTVFAPLNAWMFKAMSGHNVQILSVSIFIIGNLICAIA
ncbi:hypothetical protein ABIE71_010240, partial [Bradyrhizobium diazoefficiens]